MAMQATCHTGCYTDRMFRNPCTLALALALALLPLAAPAQIYRWVDANGQIHLTQSPPKNTTYEELAPAGAGSSGERPHSWPAPASTSAGTNPAAAQASLQNKADRAERCAKAQERISFLQDKTAHRLFVTGPDGQPARMTDEQFDEEVNDAKAAADQYCD